MGLLGANGLAEVLKRWDQRLALLMIRAAASLDMPLASLRANGAGWKTCVYAEVIASGMASA
ncbi:hypothetical protein ASG67_02495 [Sphingomonas sp. Leaf339]|nr:hypothetical protein ASG67_02495 [Sphingomonas sp. Leaf339]